MELEDPRRRILVQALSAGIGSLILGPAAARDNVTYSTEPVQLPPKQSIYNIKGEFFVNDRKADIDTPIGPNDTVRTGKNSQAIFIVGGQAMLLRDHTHLKLTGEESEKGSFILSALRLITGKVLSVSRNERVTLNTPTATIGIRGTGIYVEAVPDLTYLCTCYGETNIVASNDASSQDKVVATHHNRPIYIAAKGRAGKYIRNAGYRSHTDEELMLIETIVGRTTPYKLPYDGTLYP